MSVFHRIAGCMVATASLAAMGQTKWPEFMPTLQPGLSLSPARVELPTGLSAQSADPGLAPGRAAWLGAWRGWACLNKICDIKMFVERVSNDGATLHYAFASARANPSIVKVDGKFVDDELRVQLAGGATVAYRMRESGEAEYLWRSGDQWAAGILSKEK